jgi:outer membrane protein
MKRIVAVLALLSCAAAPVAAEERIAFANLELILARMPETAEVNQKLEAYHKELSKALDTKQAYAQQKLVEAEEAAASGIVSQEKLQKYEDELRVLMQEIRETAREADQKILKKQKELMDPVAEKLQSVIRQIAEADGYTYVLNTVDSSGTSVVLYGVEERDITRRIMEELGIPLPSGS